MEQLETLVEAAIREVKEEAGYIVEPIHLSSVEIDYRAAWFRFTFIAVIVGGSLKTLENADSESLQACWFDLELLKKKGFINELRRTEFIKTVDVALDYYNKFNIRSNTGSPNCLKLASFLPSTLPREDITFSFFMVDKNSHSYIVLNHNGQQHVPSCISVPTFFKKSFQNCFYQVIDNLLIPDCFKSSKEVKYDIKGILSVRQNGHLNEHVRYTDGIEIVFLMLIEKPVELNENIAWKKFSNNAIIEKFNKNEFDDLIKVFDF